GRTDAGVHARAQVVHFDLVPGTSRGRALDVESLARSINKLLAPAVVVRGADLAPEGFHARHSAQWRSYRYLVSNTPVPDPFLARIAWHVGSPLDLRAMSAACDAVLGEHDFSTFCRKPSSGPDAGLVRRVIDARWRDEGQGRLCLDIEATAFCHQMVRSLVGTMV
ncbi:MAG: tRNA pseudouridine synthase A, partial [Acidimicrobiales bacterium]